MYNWVKLRGSGDRQRVKHYGSLGSKADKTKYSHKVDGVWQHPSRKGKLSEPKIVLTDRHGE